MSQNAAFSLEGKHIVVTGGSRGLGRGVTLAIAAAGGTVTIVSRGESQAQETIGLIEQLGAEDRSGNWGQARALSADVSDLSSIEELVEKLSDFHPIHGVVHAAGIQLRKPAIDIEIEEFLHIQNVNLHAPYFLSTAIARRQINENRDGSHVFIGSLNSSIGLPRISPYVISKTGMVGMARAFSTEWSPHGIRANVVAPGYFETDMTQTLLANDADKQRIMARIPMKKLGEPADVGNACVYLLSPAARYVSGTLLNIDGGWLSS